eukprot:6492825-Prymnesium_polylepis.1
MCIRDRPPAASGRRASVRAGLACVRDARAALGAITRGGGCCERCGVRARGARRGALAGGALAQCAAGR